MRLNIRILTVAILALVMSSGTALAQLQPIPITQARGKPLALGAGTGSHVVSSVMDMSSFASMSITVATLGCSVLQTVGTVKIFGGSVPGFVPGSVIDTQNAQVNITSLGDGSALVNYEVADLPGYVIIDANFTLGGVNCVFTVYGVPNPISSSQVVRGPVLAGNLTNRNYPLTMGGLDTTNKVRNLRVDSNGSIYSFVNGGVSAAGTTFFNPGVPLAGSDYTTNCNSGLSPCSQDIKVDALGNQYAFVNPAAQTSSIGHEVLVLTATPTAVPAVALVGRRAVEIQNNGPNAIWCVTSGVPVLTKSRQLAASGGGIWSFDCSDVGCTPSCLSATADQVTGGATWVTELK